MTEALQEHRFDCPYCWESITIVLDLTASSQSYVEDCEICCNPIGIRFSVRDGEPVELEVERML